MGLGVAIAVITLAVVAYFVWAVLKNKSNYEKGKRKKPGDD